MELSASFSYEVGKPRATRDQIVALEEYFKANGSRTPAEADAEFVTHHYAPNLYARHMLIPEGMCVVGKIHKHAHLNVLAKGRCRVATEFGNEELVAPTVWTSEPGTKRAVVALEDVEWITIHHNPTGTEDPEIIEEHVIAKSFDEVDRFLLESGE